MNDSGIIIAKKFNNKDKLKKLLDKGDIYRYSRGIYVRNDVWEDDFYLL